jgi:hypothetical protein
MEKLSDEDKLKIYAGFEDNSMNHLLKYYIVLQPMIKKAMGEWKYRDVLYCMRQGTFHYTHEQDCCDLLIPLTIDPVNPSRGLWGVLDWTKYAIGGTKNNGDIEILELADKEKYFSSGLITPTEAILKALCHQEGVEV